MDLQRANESGGSGSSRQYNRDPKGTSTGGQFTSGGATQSAANTPTHIYGPRPKKGGGGSGAQASLPASSKFKTLSPGGDNDPAAVAEMQQLLSALGLGNLEANGQYDEATQNAVMEAQKRLGIKPNGKANKGLVNKLLNAYDLSPCVKRSEDPDPADLIRSDPQCEFTVTRSEDDVFDTLRTSVEMDEEDEDSSRSDSPLWTPQNEILRYERTWTLDDIFIQRGGDGRTVTAYAAVFDTPAEVTDQHGHYVEEVDRNAFNRELSRAKPQGGRDYWLVNCFYNHGADLSGKPNHMMSVPLGSPLDVHPDGKGLLTVTRYNKSELADATLEAIRNGDIRSQSFRGRIYRSTPDRVPRSRRGELPTIRRMELGLSEYGPTPSAVYKDAAIVAVRAEQVAQSLAELSADERSELIRMLSNGAPLGDSPPEQAVASAMELDAVDSPDGRSARIQQFREELRKRGVLK